VKRLPFLRGKSKNKVIFGKPEIVKLESLAVFSKNATVDVKSLVAAKLVDEKGAKKYGVKILGDGALSVSLTVKVAVTSSAKKKIEKAGGSVAQ
ncbi:MAG: uL15 family ribosomal protein, partial [Candidatus Levyibacteriota bacterium]